MGRLVRGCWRLGLGVVALAIGMSGAASAATVPPGTASDTVTPRTIAVPGDAGTIAAAVASAQAGDTIAIGPGVYPEEFTVAKNLRLVGAGQGVTVIRGAGHNVVTVSARVTMERLSVTGGENGIYVDAGGFLELRHVTAEDNNDSGVRFRDTRASTVSIHDSLFARNGDGVNVNSTNGVIERSTFIDNFDDGIDFDGDTNIDVLDNEIVGSGDDGIEIRLQQFTVARIVGNLVRNIRGEDGIEVIESFLPLCQQPNTCSNRLLFVDNRIAGTGRFGIGFVDVATEADAHWPVVVDELICSNNQISGGRIATFSPNYAGVLGEPAGVPPIGPVAVGNVTDSALSLSWVSPYTGTATATAAPISGGLAITATETHGGDDTHLVTLRALQPATAYSVTLRVGDSPNPSARLVAMTGPTIDLTVPAEPLRGYLFLADGLTPASGAVVLVRFEDADGLGSLGASALLLTSVGPDGSWQLDLPPRRADAQGYFDFGPADRFRLVAEGGHHGGVARQLPADGTRFLRGLNLEPRTGVAIQAGWTLVALPAGTEPAGTAEGLLQQLAVRGIEATQVVRWDNGAWQSHLRGFPANDFALEVGRGYFVRSSTAGVWRP